MPRSDRDILSTPLCEKLGIELPIVQAGMGKGVGYITTAPLVAAVSEAGGLGCIGATGLDPDQLAEVIDEVRSLTSKPFGVDLLVPQTDAEADASRQDVLQQIQDRFPEHWAVTMALYERFGIERTPVSREFGLSPTLIRQQVQTVLDKEVPVFASGLGSPDWMIEQAHQQGTVVFGLAGSVNQAHKQLNAGVDVLVAQGAEAGGHTGKVGQFALLPQILDMAGDTPVIAAGAIGDGRGLAAALAFGAQGVWVGTRFLFSDEVRIPEEHFQQLTSSRSEDLVVSRTYTGKTSRVYNNAVLAAWAESGLEPLRMPYQTILFEEWVESAENAGRQELVQNAAGQIAGMLTDRQPAATIVADMAASAAASLRRFG